MMTAEDNDLLCRVVGDAPMGQLMRRHWQPVCLSEEVLDPDGPPVKARVFGEDLVVFRDSDGRVGVLDAVGRSLPVNHREREEFEAGQSVVATREFDAHPRLCAGRLTLGDHE